MSLEHELLSLLLFPQAAGTVGLSERENILCGVCFFFKSARKGIRLCVSLV